MKASKLFVLILALFQGQFIKAQCDTIALKKDLTFPLRSGIVRFADNARTIGAAGSASA